MSYQNPNPEQFNPIVWDIVRQIGRGEVATYGQIAAMILAPDGVAEADYKKLGPRWVGDAMNAVSAVDEPTVPWHRVINAKGGISLPENSRAAKQQRERLIAEGVVFGKGDVVDFKVVGWAGPDDDYIRAKGLNPPRSLKPPKPNDGQMSLF